MNHNLYANFLFKSRDNQPLFILPNGAILTYADIDNRVAQFCHVFITLGLKKGDRVLSLTDKSTDAFCIYLASLRSGTIFIPLNPEFRTDEITYFVQDAMPSLIICSDDKTHLFDLCKKHLPVETIDANNKGTLQNKANSLATEFTSVLCAPDDTACILYTSGTTGKPKGAMLSHYNLFINGNEIKTAWAMTENDILLHMLPIFHCHGLFFAMNSIMLSGARAIFCPKFEVTQALHFLPRATLFMGVPTYYTRLLADFAFTPSLVNNVRLFISGSAPLLQKTFIEFEQKTGKKILERYGMTETGIIASHLLHDRIPGSVGIPLPSTKVRIVDNEDVEVPDGSPGHIQVKGDSIFTAYWRRDHLKHEYFTKDNYFRTGDIGIKNTNQYVQICGRAKDIIITGGLNVYPQEIEDVINALDFVKETAVIGLPDEDFGEAVTAVISLSIPNANAVTQIIAHVKSKLANYKVPKAIILVDNLPKNTMGKVQKNILRQQLRIPAKPATDSS